MEDKKHIFIIEDELSLCNIYKEVLEHEGFRVSFAGEGQEGVRRVKEEKPDLILLDLVLPGMDGFEVLRTLKADDVTKNIPIIILSVIEGKQDVNRGLDMGASGYLSKSRTDLIELLRIVKEHLGSPGK